MVIKIPLAEIEKMDSKSISAYMTDITQTPICADKAYCNSLLKIWQSKPFDFMEDSDDYPELIDEILTENYIHPDYEAAKANYIAKELLTKRKNQ